MSRSILLVCGSRALTERPEAEAWAREILWQTILALPRVESPHAASVVVVGDASGPDAWALDIAGQTACARWCRYALDGYRYKTDGVPMSWSAMPALPVAKAWPLVRNAVMVREVAGLARDFGDVVRVIGLVSPWATTHGTEHTLGLARRAGLPVERWVYDTAGGAS